MTKQTRRRKREESNSTDLELRCFAPQMIVEAYRRAEAPLGDYRDRLGWTMGFIDILQRYFVAILANEHAGLGLDPPQPYSKLINKLRTPSLGDWGQAMEAFAQALLPRAHELVVPEFPAILVTLDEEGGFHRSVFTQHMVDLVDIRNARVCHEDGTIIPDEGTAKQILAEIRIPLRTICTSLRLLKRYPVLYLHRQSMGAGGGYLLDLFRFSGRDATRVQPEFAQHIPVPDGTAFILSESGEYLSLSPFVLADAAPNGAWQMWLLNNVNPTSGKFEYTALHGGDRGSFEESKVGPLHSQDLLRGA